MDFIVVNPNAQVKYLQVPNFLIFYAIVLL